MTNEQVMRDKIKKAVLEIIISFPDGRVFCTLEFPRLLGLNTKKYNTMIGVLITNEVGRGGT